MVDALKCVYVVATITEEPMDREQARALLELADVLLCGQPGLRDWSWIPRLMEACERMRAA